MSERKILAVVMGWWLLMIGCSMSCRAKENSTDLTVQSFFHYKVFDYDEYAYLIFKPVNQIEELLENSGFSLINQGVEYIEDYFEDFSFMVYKSNGIEVKVYISPEGQNIVEFIEMKFDSSNLKQKFLDDSEKKGLTKGENGYYMDGFAESGIVVILLDNGMLWISDFSV